MNLKEGTRRLALLLGVAGAIGGGFVSYLELDTTIEQRTRHNRFEQLAGSDVMKRFRKDHLESKDPYEAHVKSFMPGCCGVKEITWDTDHIWNDSSGFYSIETDSGQTLYPTPAPAAWQYLFVVLVPIFGFIIPWVVVLAIGWVVAGFVQSVK